LESIVPQLVTVAFVTVAQVTVQVTAVLLEPVIEEENCSVVLVTTLEVVGEIARTMLVELLPPPHPQAPSARARVSIEQNFHGLIPILQTFLDLPCIGAGFIPNPRPTIPARTSGSR
jgi:hypothetical protein